MWSRSPIRALSGGTIMNLSAPTMPLFLVSLVLAVLALIGHFVTIPFVSMYQFWIAIVAYIVIAVGCVMKGA